MRIILASSAVGALLTTLLVAARTPLSFATTGAAFGSAVTLALLFMFALALFALASWGTRLVPRSWPAVARWCIVVLLAFALALGLRFYQFLPAAAVYAWCQTGLPCGEIGNFSFNSVASAGRGIVVLLLLPVLTVPTMSVGYWLHMRQRSAHAPSAA